MIEHICSRLFLIHLQMIFAINHTFVQHSLFIVFFLLCIQYNLNGHTCTFNCSTYLIEHVSISLLFLICLIWFLTLGLILLCLIANSIIPMVEIMLLLFVHI